MLDTKVKTNYNEFRSFHLQPDEEIESDHRNFGVLHGRYHSLLRCRLLRQVFGSNIKSEASKKSPNRNTAFATLNSKVLN